MITSRFALFAAIALRMLYGQSDTRIVGIVTDASAAVIPAASVSVTNESTGQIRKVTANEQGLFVVAQLQPAPYRVKVESPGMSAAEYTGIRLQVGQERTLNVTLQPSAVTTEVNVSGGDLTVIDYANAKIGANVNEREVANLPLNGRQVSQLYLLAPGALTAGSGSFDNIRFSGRANEENEIRIDGVEATSVLDASPGNLNGEISSGFRLQSSLETIQEFRVDSSNYPAELGTGTGGQISVITKSGGNVLHGALFEYLRNDTLDSRNFFDGVTKSPLKLNQFGGSIGGPLIKNKMFFFANYEGLRQHAGINLIGTVPSLAARGRAVPSIASIVNAFPVGQRATSNPDLDVAQLSTTSTLTENYGTLRLDYKLNNKYTMYVRYMRDQGVSDSPIEGTSVSGSRFLVTAVPQNALINLNQMLAPTLINETKLALNSAKTRASGFAPPIPGVLNPSAISVDFTGNATIPGIAGQISSAEPRGWAVWSIQQHTEWPRPALYQLQPLLYR